MLSCSGPDVWHLWRSQGWGWLPVHHLQWRKHIWTCSFVMSSPASQRSLLGTVYMYIVNQWSMYYCPWWAILLCILSWHLGHYCWGSVSCNQRISQTNLSELWSLYKHLWTTCKATLILLQHLEKSNDLLQQLEALPSYEALYSLFFPQVSATSLVSFWNPLHCENSLNESLLLLHYPVPRRLCPLLSKTELADNSELLLLLLYT